ncbi:hypothetical protein CAPTEDRAFT_206415 [Capitella teleta]|uniref:Uncharacterized protein n=1 Tax=Capitella teleta TaxID=283909 RepID=R7TEY5_CAPTE|nr:hypothetical protein CAPTEDRAFT_206415 [Capitella teleta]|eukprot:ELT90042.1 hypothetical protein CAPTEDRAFT_206415 [Capitella teleta]
MDNQGLSDSENTFVELTSHYDTWNTPLSPYTYNLAEGQLPTTATSIQLLGDGGAKEMPVTYAAPPTGHHGDFHIPDDEDWDAYYDDDNYGDEGSEDFLYEDKFKVRDKRTLFGQLQQELLPQDENSVTNTDNQNHIKNGFKIADHLTKVPLSIVWHGFTEFWAASVFLSNAIVAIYDIVRSATYLQYKVTALILGVVENLLVVGLWAVRKHPKFKSSPNYEQNIKYFQYAENIIHELLIFPLFIISIVGFATERMYQTPEDAFGWTQLILLVIDTIELVFTQGLRVFMVYRFMRDIQGVLKPGTSKGLCAQQFAGLVLSRAYLTFLGNVVLMLLLATMMGIQVHSDNYTSSNYHLTFRSGMLMVCLLILPIFSFVLFILANAYWIMEILIGLNLSVGQDESFSDKLKENYGEAVQGALQYAQHKIPASSKRLESLRETPTHKKALYGVLEIPIVLCIFVYEILLLSSLFLFNGFADPWQNNAVVLCFLVVLVAANIHLIALMALSNLSIVLIVLSVLVYPFTVPICCRRKQQVDQTPFEL